MPRIALPPVSRNALSDPAALFGQLRTVLDAIEQQINLNPQVSSSRSNTLEKGLQSNDLVIRYVGSILKLGIFDGKKARFLTAADLQVLQNPNPNTQFKGMQSGTALVTAGATLAQFPNINDWGFYNRTSTSTLYFVYNYSGSVLKSVTLT